MGIILLAIPPATEPVVKYDAQSAMYAGHEVSHFVYRVLANNLT